MRHTEQSRKIVRGMMAGVAMAALGALGAGCESYAPPELTVTGAQAGERTPDGVSMVFTIDAKNDNEVALPLRDVVYTVELDGQRVFEGTRSPEATLRREGVQQIRLPAVVNLTSTPGAAGAASGPSRFRLSGTMRYITPGQLAEVLFDTGVRVPSVSFSGEGEVDLSTAKALSASPNASFVPLPDTAPAPESPVMAP